MNIQEIYELKENLIIDVISKATGKIFDDIDNDDDFTLSTDEMIDLTYDLLKIYFNKYKLLKVK